MKNDVLTVSNNVVGGVEVMCQQLSSLKNVREIPRWHRFS